MRKKAARIIVVDDQQEIVFAARMLIKRNFEEVITATSPKDVMQLLAGQDIDVILMDMNYRIGYEDGREGVYWLKEILDMSPNTSIILMTAFGKVDVAVECIKLGAFDFILKPWDNDKLVETINAGVEHSRKKRKHIPESNTAVPEKKYFRGNSKSIQQAYSIADKVALTDANVLLLGENGTGKYVFAQYIHEQSLRKNTPFVAVDLGSLHENIFESELFGYARGAYTDARTDQPGRFEMAQGGTIFLDEIGNLPLHLQSKLLSVLQSKSVTRLGESRPRPIDVRIITATNIDIHDEVKKKTFRQDLLYRINTVEITLPPLKQRKEDILPLADFFLERSVSKYDKPEKGFSEDARQTMLSYTWPGNIREMENMIERAVILSDKDTISAYELNLSPIDDETIEAEDFQLSDMEKLMVERTLHKHRGNISKAAEELGISRAALYRRIEKYKL